MDEGEVGKRVRSHLSGGERGRREFMAMHRESLAAEIEPIVPDVVLAQA